MKLLVRQAGYGANVAFRKGQVGSPAYSLGCKMLTRAWQ